MFDIRELIDKDGVLRIPEEIQIISKEGTEGLCCRPEIIGFNSFDFLTEMKELHIPASIKEIKWPFYECTNLERIVVVEANQCFKDIDGVLYSKDGKTLIAYPNAHGKDYQVPAGVVTIAHFAFKSCSDIEIVHLPQSVREIGINAFYRCNKLKEVHLPDELKKFECSTENANVRSDFFYKGDKYKYEDIIKVFQ